MSLKDYLEKSIEAAATIGYPAIKERFLLRNGQEYEVTALKGRRMQMGQCYRNSSIRAERGDGTYVEGIAKRSFFPIAISHAWLAVDGKAMDPTWRPPLNAGMDTGVEYLGVEFSTAWLLREQRRTGYYGMLEGPGGMLNVDLMFELDPELKGIAEEIIGRELPNRTYAFGSL